MKLSLATAALFATSLAVSPVLAQTPAPAAPEAAAPAAPADTMAPKKTATTHHRSHHKKAAKPAAAPASDTPK
jgi:hypothetical protein